MYLFKILASTNGVLRPEFGEGYFLNNFLHIGLDFSFLMIKKNHSKDFGREDPPVSTPLPSTSLDYLPQS